MAEVHTITCEECGQPYDTIRRNTKYCRVCRLLKDLIYVESTTKGCWLCDQRFAPLHRKDEACWDCAPRTGKMIDGACALCQAHDHPLLGDDIRVCLRCAKDPAKRKLFARAVKKKVDARKAEVLT